MRQFIVTQNMSVDGRVDMLDPWFNPSDQDPEIAAELRRQDATNDALVLGRGTFEAFRSFWPEQHDDTTGVTAHLNHVQKYVVSSTMTDLGWENSTVLAGDLVDEINQLKQQQGGDIVCTGSVEVAHQLIAARLVDEYRMFVFPAVQGRGRYFFPDGFRHERLTLKECRRFDSGVTYLSYLTPA